MHNSSPASTPFPTPVIRLVPCSLLQVEEFIDGGTLKAMVTQCIKTGKRIYSMQDGVRWLADVAKGLQYLHESIPKVWEMTEV